MEPIQIALLVLAVAGVWAVIELALFLRRTRGAVDSLDRTVGQLNDTLAEARPVVAKLDGVVDELQPAVAQIEPLLKQANVAAEALSADLVEVNGVLRDISEVSGTASAASRSVNGIADAASEKVQRIIGRVRGAVADKDDLALTEPVPSDRPVPDVAAAEEPPAPEADAPRQYYTYSATEEPTDE